MVRQRVTAADVADEWIHEGWGTYLECVYVEHMFGYDDALKYINGYKSKVRNREPIITPRGINRTPPQDMYFKGALFLHTLRSVVGRRRPLVEAAARLLPARSSTRTSRPRTSWRSSTGRRAGT